MPTARREKHDGRVELVGRVVPVASRDEGHRPTRAHVHSGRSDGRAVWRTRATQEHELHLYSSHYEIFELEIDSLYVYLVVWTRRRLVLRDFFRP